jgi:hypothetical protein
VTEADKARYARWNAIRRKGQREWMRARAERVAQMHAEGLTWAEIGRRLGLSAQQVQRSGRKMGLQPNPVGVLAAVSRDEYEAARPVEVAARYGVTCGAVYHKARREGWR